MYESPESGIYPRRSDSRRPWRDDVPNPLRILDRTYIATEYCRALWHTCETIAWFAIQVRASRVGCIPGMKNPKKYYLVGICGTAMASLAGMLKSTGYTVSGSDSDVYPPMSTYLEELGIRVYNGYKSENLAEAAPDIVVIGNAVSRGNPEVEQVLDSGVRYQSMAETVKELFIRGKNSIVVSGTHGKTTTTAMLAWMLQSAGKKPSFLVGGIAENFGGSF